MISLRGRLALWSVGVLGLTLAIFGMIVYLTVEQALLDKLDASLADRAQRTSLYLVVAERAPYFIPENLQKTLANFSSPDVALQVMGVDGRVLAHSATWRLGSLTLPPGARGTSSAGAIALASESTAVGSFRSYTTPLYAGRTLAGFLAVAAPLTPTRQVLETLSSRLVAVGLLALGLATAVVMVLARRAVRPVAAVTRTAQAITVSGQLDQRVPYHGPPDEIGQLAATFNGMLARLDETQAAQRRFVADASHELRTPLTSILGSAEALARMHDAPREERAEAVADIIAEAQRLARLITGLLSLARADGGQHLLVEEVRMDQLAHEMVVRVAAAHPRSMITLQADTAVCARGDPDRLRELVVILLDNAVKYSSPWMPVTCTIDVAGGCARLCVHDQGLGISPRDLPHIFERFYRARSARQYDQGGTGLGLPIAAWIVQQHQGQLDVQSVEGEGTTVTVLLPLSRR